MQFEVYLLSIEMARDHIYAPQKKHVLELLKFGLFGMQTENYIHQSESEVGCSHFKNNNEQGTISEIGGILIHLSHTLPEIAYVIGLLVNSCVPNQLPYGSNDTFQALNTYSRQRSSA